MSNEVIENGVDIRTIIAEVLFLEHDIVTQATDEDAKNNALKNEKDMIKLLIEVNKNADEALEADIRLANEKEISEKKLEIEKIKAENESEKIKLDRERLEQERHISDERLRFDCLKLEREVEIEDKKIEIAMKAQELEEKRITNEEQAEKNRAFASKLQLGLSVINIITNVLGLKASKDVVMGTLALNFSDNCMRDKDSYVAAKKAMDDVLKKISMR